MIELIEQRRAARQKAYARLLANGTDVTLIELFNIVDDLDDALAARMAADVELLKKGATIAAAGFVDQHGKTV